MRPTAGRPSDVLGEAEVRPALRSRLQRTDAVFIEELGLCRGQVRVDLAVVDGLLRGFEIKSDRDSLRRLHGQVGLYGRVLDRVTLVVGQRHLAEALDMVPAWWGVLRIDSTAGGPRFATVRRGLGNTQRDPRALVELLGLEEALALLSGSDAARGVRGKPRRIVWDRVCERFQVDEIAAAVRAALKARAARQAPG